MSSGAGVLLHLLRDRAPRTRSELAELTGLGRSAVAQRVDALLAQALLEPVGEATSTGGRPPARFAFNPRARVVLAADVGATHVRLALTDLASVVLDEATIDIDIAAGPDVVLGWIVEQGRSLLAANGRRVVELAGVGIGLPGPVEFATGRPVNPPIMPGWHDFDVVAYMTAAFECVVVVDNDVNVMALGERAVAYPDVEHLLFVKVATGIGSGIVIDGTVRRGAQGAAGDLGHIQVPHDETARCRCGNVGCLEAVASGAAIAAELTALGEPASSSREVADLVRAGSVRADRLVREAGRTIGEVLASAVSLLNPSVIVIGGSLALAGESLLAGVREVVYRRSLPLATANLQIVGAQAGDRAGVIGASVLVCDRVLAPDAVDGYLSTMSAPRPGT
jgi:predicted NBD/HSP70 family sugar kinase